MFPAVERQRKDNRSSKPTPGACMVAKKDSGKRRRQKTLNDRTRRHFLKTAGGMILSAGMASPSDKSLVAFAAGEEPGRSKRPNILLFLPDQFRYDWITGNANDIPARTPHLSRLATEGIWFRRAIVPSPLCAPSRACLASGKQYERCGVSSNEVDYPLEQPTFYSMLRASGYWTAACGKLDLNKPDDNTGLDGKRYLKAWGFSDGINSLGKIDAIVSGAVTPTDPYMAYLHKRGLATEYVAYMHRLLHAHNAGTSPSPLPENAYCDNWIGQNGLELMRHFPKGKPWFLIVNFAGPHSPWNVTRRMWERWQGVNFPPPNGPDGYSEAINNAIRRNYSAMGENIDRWIGIYLDRVRERGELENTLIVFCSDHGEMLGDHGLWGKSVPYQPSVSVPLIVAGAGVKKTGSSDVLVNTMDLTATFLDYAGVVRPGDMDSLSLRPVLEGKTSTHRQEVLSGLGPWRMVFDGRYKLIRGYNPKGRRWMHQWDPKEFIKPATEPLLLFDLEADPRENINLIPRAGNVALKLSDVLLEVEHAMPS